MRVVTDGGFGTAFYMGNSEFITAAHLVEGYPTVQLEAFGLVVAAEVVGLSSPAGIAVLRATMALKPLEWGASLELTPGQSVAVAGFPAAGQASAAGVASGSISRLFALTSGQRVMETDAPLNPGFSGGPIFDECGLVVGMATSQIVDEAAGGVVFAIAETSVRSALPDARAHPLSGCAAFQFNIERGSTETFSFGFFIAGARVAGEFSVAQGAFRDLDVQFELTDRLGQSASYTLQTQSFRFEALSALAHVTFSDDGSSLLTSTSFIVSWCVYG